MGGMSQLALPLDEPSVPPPPSGGGRGRHAREVTEDDVQSSEESRVEPVFAAGADARVAPATRPAKLQNSSRPASLLRAWPAALTWSDALDYSSFSPAQLRRWEKAGALRFRRVGRNGAKVVMRFELDRLLEQAFAPASTDVAEDFDFG